MVGYYLPVCHEPAVPEGLVVAVGSVPLHAEVALDKNIIWMIHVFQVHLICERSWVQFPQFPSCPGTWSSGMILA